MEKCKPHQGHSHWIFTSCGGALGTSAALPIMALLSHIQAFVKKGMTQREVKPQERSTRDQQYLVKTGGTSKPIPSRQAKQVCCMVRCHRTFRSLGQVSFLLHQHSSDIPAPPPSCAVGRLLGAVNTAASAALTHTIPEQDGTGRHRAAELAEGAKPSSVMCHLQFCRGS